MSLHDYMAACVHAYYQRRHSIGRGGDFTTAPEISQMFGEIVGGWLAYHAQQQSVTDQAVLVDCGGGRGVLLADVLRLFQSTSPPITVAAIHIIETSPTLQQAQRSHLTAITDLPIHWHADVADVPHAPMLVLANEFFDCFPIHQYRYCHDQDTWQLRYVINGEAGDLAFAWHDFTPPPHWPQDSSNQAIHEFAPAHANIMSTLASRIAQHGGAGLIVDYGRLGFFGDSLQAMRQHQPIHPLACPGDADMTAWVNFAHLADKARAAGAFVLPLQSQGAFLRDMGIMQRAELLGQGKSPAVRRQLVAAIDRLTSPAHMGEAFSVMGVLPSPTQPYQAGGDG